MDLTDKQWAVLEPIFRPRRRPDGRGRRNFLQADFPLLNRGKPPSDRFRLADNTPQNCRVFSSVLRRL
jgi:hypothetical protein